MHPSPRIGASSPEPQRVAPNELTPVHQRSSRRLRATLRLEFSKDLASSIETMHCWKGDNAAIYVQVTRASYFLRAARACFSRSTEVRANRAGQKEKKRRCGSLTTFQVAFDLTVAPGDPAGASFRQSLFHPLKEHGHNSSTALMETPTLPSPEFSSTQEESGGPPALLEPEPVVAASKQAPSDTEPEPAPSLPAASVSPSPPTSLADISRGDQGRRYPLRNRQPPDRF
ncbi:hypothetical protein HPB50_015643 [Hyalomma asiaticum]|uniref:Uncharacterized protein n=1 Tax=Hyalomma asiaticum TaxID=266040 RepID=A0ACB7TPS8_HYAAI|nr:hypothetical protein HPB50_015643 [Hyalomma asiaticum]